MTPLEELASKLRTFWLRDIGASSASTDTSAAADGSIALGRTVFIPAVGGLVGINQVPSDPYALDVSGHARIAGNLYARAGNAWNMGADGTPWASIYASDLHVGNLIAENKIATTAGRILISPSTKVILAMTTGATTIDVAANTLTSGDRIYLESTGKLEWMAVTSGSTAVTGGYRYSVTRNLNGAGAQTWSAGDAVVNTGQTGQGFIDLYSRYGIPANGETATTRQGPTIVGNVRLSSTYDDIEERWAIGNLKGLYNYAATTYGFAAGVPGAAWLGLDATNGLRMMQSDETRVQLTAAGVLTINNSDSQAVFTFDSSTGAEFTLPLTLGAAGGIYQGTGTFASPTTGLKIYNSGGIGLIAGYNTGTVQWYADTDGKLYAGAGSVKLDSSGITLAMGSGYTAENAIKFGTASDVQIYSGYSSSTKRLFVTSQPLTPDNAEVNIWSRVGSGSGTGLIDLTAADDVGAGAYAGIGYLKLRSTGANTMWGSLGFLGTTSGTATIVAPAVAGTPTLTLPTTTGTLALTSDVTAAVSGTTGSLAKFTAANVVGNATIADFPQRVIVTRSLNGALTNYTQIGTWTAATGAHNLRVSVTVDTAGVTTIAKTFVVCCKYAQTSGVWQIVPAIADSGLYTSDFQLVVNQSAAAVELRLYSFNGGGGGTNTYTIDMENVGFSTDTFAALSGASTMTAPTATLASATDYHAIRGGITLVKTIPTTVGNYVEICQLVNGLGGNPFRISISNSDSGFSNSKQYVIASSYGATAGWVIVAPISDSKYTTAQDYELCINQGGGTTYFRLLRTAGTSAGTAYVQIQWDGAYAGAYGELTGTGSMTVPTTYAPHNMLTQVGGGVLIKGGYLSTDMDTMTYAATITLDVTLGNLHKTTTVNATGNATINASAVGKAGQPLWILIVNDATSGKVITFGTNFKSTGTLTGTASKQATVHFISDGVSWSEVARSLAL